jgi:hypothetical protein
MVSKGKARLFKRKDNKYLIYVPKDLAEDSMFPFKLEGEENSVQLEIVFDSKNKKLIVG